MKTWEKALSIFAIVFMILYATALTFYPALRQMAPLLIGASIGLIINIGFMFVILKNILTNNRFEQSQKITWVALVLVIWPMAIVYFIRYGFKANSSLPTTEQ